MLKLFIVSIALVLSILGCASSGSLASSPDAFLSGGGQLPEQSVIDCGQGGGQCTKHIHKAPKRRAVAEALPNFYPISGYKRGLTSSLDR